MRPTGTPPFRPGGEGPGRTLEGVIRSRAAALLAPLALVCGATAVAALPTAPSTAETAGSARAAVATSYRCSSSFGSYTGDVALRVDLPASVKAGARVPGRRVAGAVVVPDDVADQMRQLGVTAVSARIASSPARLGTARIPIDTFVVPRTELPADGPFTLVAATRAGAFTAPTKPGRYPVLVPAKVSPALTAYRGSSSFGPIRATCTPVDDTAALGRVRVTR